MNTAEDNILSIYLKEINRIPLLSREKEMTLARQAAAGDSHAKELMVKANLRFVVNVAKKYQNHGLDLTDLINEGNIGLMTAVDRFDVDKGYHFISYAVWWIRQAIIKAICEKSRMIRLPLNRTNELTQIERVRKALGAHKTEAEEIAEIAEALDMDQGHVREMLNISREMISLDAAARASDQDSASIGDFIEDIRYEEPEMAVINRSMRDDIETVLGELPVKEAAVLRCRYGLNGKKAMSLREVGSVFNLTKERIRQIEKKALTRLQHPSRMEKLEVYVA